MSASHSEYYARTYFRKRVCQKYKKVGILHLCQHMNLYIEVRRLNINNNKKSYYDNMRSHVQTFNEMLSTIWVLHANEQC